VLFIPEEGTLISEKQAIIGAEIFLGIEDGDVVLSGDAIDHICSSFVLFSVGF